MVFCFVFKFKKKSSVNLWRDMQQQKEENESVSKCPSFPSEAVKLPAV